MFVPYLVRIGCVAILAAALDAAAADHCVAPGQWAAPADAQAKGIAADRLFAQLSQRRAILLGEVHDNADHHRWQLHTIAGLHALHPQLVIALEMFPHRVQNALDQWVAGELTEEQLLTRTQWRTVWGEDPGLYLPIFNFARMHRVPMIALNVERSLTRKVGEQGWAAIAPQDREGVSNPAPAPPAYADMLYESFQQHAHGSKERDDPAFQHFVDGMLLWDRAMAQGIAEAAARAPGTMVVGLMGLGHLENRDGVPRQLVDLGIKDAAVLLPWDRARSCSELTPQLADALFGIDSQATAVPERPRLGVMLEQSEQGVRIAKVTDGSIAQGAGLQPQDVIETVAGERVSSVDDVVAAVSRQSPGTWLPISIRRAGQPLDIVARFPPRPRQ
jgi:uncharacterized iron-regulated protein